MFAYCYRGGDIHFGEQVPAGAIELMRGSDNIVKGRITVRARHAYDGKTLLVPGVPEAEDEFGAEQAVEQFKRFLTTPRRKVRGA
jgi:hypothetical protein